MKQDLFIFLLRQADNANFLGHRFAEWCGHAPMLEEDLAFGNIGLDLIGQARILYQYAAEIEGKGRNEDDLCYLRQEGQYRNILLVELPNGDFAFTIARLCFYASFMQLWWRSLLTSCDETIAGLAAKAEKEASYHRRHAHEWLIRLGDGTRESALRAQTAVDTLWRYTGEMFAVDAHEKALINQGIISAADKLHKKWQDDIEALLLQACLKNPGNMPMVQGGRDGKHTEHMGYILTEMQYLQRAFPGASW